MKATTARRWLAAAVLLVAAVAIADERKSESGFVELFNGKDLDGWVQRGGKAKYSVEDGAIVGTTVPNVENAFLCTTRDYADFVLELDFKVHPKLNSGVQIRSHVTDKDTTVEGRKRKHPAGRVYGYQVEIDPSPRAFTGGVYDEARRGKFLADLKDNEAGRKAFKPDDWNHFKIECQGDAIKVWLNGVSTADFKDSMDKSGFIALQVHGVKDKPEPMQVRWKNIRIKELR
jgi:hypothetical protein